MSPAQVAHRDPALFRSTLELLPAGVYTCDSDGRITWFNAHAAKLWGREPQLDHDSDRYCGAFRLLSSHLQAVPPESSWMAMALRDRRPYLAHEIVIERPDHSHVTVLCYVTPLLGPDGELSGAVNILVDISDRKRVERLLADASRANDFYRSAVAEAMREELAPMHDALAAIEDIATPAEERVVQVALLRAQLRELSSLVDQLVDGHGLAQPEG